MFTSDNKNDIKNDQDIKHDYETTHETTHDSKHDSKHDHETDHDSKRDRQYSSFVDSMSQMHDEIRDIFTELTDPIIAHRVRLYGGFAHYYDNPAVQELAEIFGDIINQCTHQPH